MLSGRSWLRETEHARNVARRPGRRPDNPAEPACRVLVASALLGANSFGSCVVAVPRLGSRCCCLLRAPTGRYLGLLCCFCAVQCMCVCNLRWSGFLIFGVRAARCGCTCSGDAWAGPVSSARSCRAVCCRGKKGPGWQGCQRITRIWVEVVLLMVVLRYPPAQQQTTACDAVAHHYLELAVMAIVPRVCWACIVLRALFIRGLISPRVNSTRPSGA